MKETDTLVCCITKVDSLQTVNLEHYSTKLNNDIAKALKLWAQDIILIVAKLNELSDEVSQFIKKNPDLDIGVHVDDDFIWIDDCEGLYEHLSNKQLLTKDYL